MIIPYTSIAEHIKARYPYTIATISSWSGMDHALEWLEERFGPYQSTIINPRWIDYDQDQRWDLRMTSAWNCVFYFIDQADAALFKIMFSPPEGSDVED